MSFRSTLSNIIFWLLWLLTVALFVVGVKCPNSILSGKYYIVAILSLIGNFISSYDIYEMNDGIFVKDIYVTQNAPCLALPLLLIFTGMLLNIIIFGKKEPCNQKTLNRQQSVTDKQQNVPNVIDGKVAPLGTQA
jgi:uncharacterized membrane protein YiaA